MKKLLIIVFVGLFSAPVNAQNVGYSIRAKIDGLPDGILFYLVKSKTSGGFDTVSRVKSKNQQFLFEGVLSLEAEIHFVKMDTTVLKLEKKKRSWVRLLLDNSTIQLNGDFKQWPEVQVKGSLPTQEYEAFLQLTKYPLTEYNKEVEKFNNQVGEDKDSAQINNAKQTFNEVYLKSLESFPNSYAVPLLILSNSVLELQDKEEAYDKLSYKLKNSFYGVKLNNLNLQNRASLSIVIGKIMPDFSIKTSEGNIQSIKEVIGQSEFTLIDFWASWCVPCREEIPNLKRVYNDFNGKGFNIVSISVDKSQKAWKKALSEEMTPWINGLDVSNIWKGIFDMLSVPGHVLVKRNGEIIALDYTSGAAKKYVVVNKTRQSLRGQDLYRKIDELVK
ncbi:MAG TPA: TlpA disulfide reductase family protein [Ferruginibacter sp.]|nr:TlpA disulfide reductase family protein [Ferruginibacter sp.]